MALWITFCLLVSILFGIKADNVNPEGYDFFDPDYVWELKQSEAAMQTLHDEPLIHYFWFDVPENAASVSITLNNTNYGGACNSALVLGLNFPLGNSQTTGFPCIFGDGSSVSMCSKWDYFYVHETPQNYVIDAFAPINPGEKIFISIQESSMAYECDYVISAAVTQTCEDGQVVYAITESNTNECLDYIMVEESDDVLTGILDYGQSLVFRTDFPKNTVRAWIQIQSATSSEWYINLLPTHTSDYLQLISGVSHEETWWTNYQNDAPEYGPTYWHIRSTANNSDYSIQFHWDVCDSDKVGTGSWNDYPDGPNPSDCYCEQKTAVLPDEFPTTKKFKGVYNPDPINNSNGGINYLLKVPFGTTGHVNISCETSHMSTLAYVTFGTGGQMTDCSNYYDYISCSDSFSTGSLMFLSNTLYGGGEFSIMICTSTQEASPIDVTLTMNGMVELGEMSSASEFGYIALASLVFAMLLSNSLC